MEEVLLRFHYIGDEIFYSLDEKSLENCKKVCRTWKNFIANPNKKFIWIQIIKDEENAFLLKNFINGPKPKWSKLGIKALRDFANRLNSEKDKSKRAEMFLKKYAELKVELNAKMDCGRKDNFSLGLYVWSVKVCKNTSDKICQSQN